MQREAEKIVMRQLNRRLGEIEPPLEQRVRELPLDQIEALSEALLDFTEISDARELVEPSLRQIAKIVRARSALPLRVSESSPKGRRNHANERQRDRQLYSC